jgi:hypothetical protein
MQVQDNSITSVARWVLGLGGAKTRKTGAYTPPVPAQTRAKAPGYRRIVRLTIRAHRRFTPPAQRVAESVAIDLLASVARGVAGVAVGVETGAEPALTDRAASRIGFAEEGRKKLPFQPEELNGRLMQVRAKSMAYVARRALGFRCAKSRKTRAQSPPRPAQSGAMAADVGQSPPTGAEPKSTSGGDERGNHGARPHLSAPTRWARRGVRTRDWPRPHPVRAGRTNWGMPAVFLIEPASSS